MRCRRGIALWAAVVLLSGCQSTSYRAGRLPQKFRATELSQSRAIDFASVAMPGSSSAMIAPSDLLEITVATGRENEQVNPITARVADDGTVDVPVVGSVPVAGMEAFDASKNITDIAVQRGMYRHPIITVEIKSKAVNRVTVLGAVKEPGMVELPRGGSDLVSAIAASGGLTEEAGTVVEIIRQPRNNQVAAAVGGVSNANGQAENLQASFDGPGLPADSQSPDWLAPQTLRLDLADSQAKNNVDFRLNDRDFVRVVPRKKEVIHVAGLVSKPGQFELPLEQDIHLLDAIALAGGRSSSVADKVFVIRRVEDQPKPIVIQASIAKAKQDGLENLRLMAGDSVSVEQTPATVVLDSISKFFRISFGVASSTVF
jgi:polysaccharide export outer membrane protein